MKDNEYSTFGEARARLDEIVAEVRSKDVSLERSLDLYEEAIKIGNRCAELADKPDYTPEEVAQAQSTLENVEREAPAHDEAPAVEE